MHRFSELAEFLGEELLQVAIDMADGSYWRDDDSRPWSETPAPQEPASWD